MELNFSSASFFLLSIVCFSAVFQISSTEAFCESGESVPVTNAGDCAVCKTACAKACKGSPYIAEQCEGKTSGFSCNCCCSDVPFTPPTPAPPSSSPPPPVICEAEAVDIYSVPDCDICKAACGKVCKDTSLIREQCASKTNAAEFSCQCCCSNPMLMPM